MRNVRIAVALLAMGSAAACGSKKSSEGLPPATEWGNTTAEPSDPLIPMPTMKPKGPHDNMPPGHPPVGDMGSDDEDGSSDHPAVVMADKTPASRRRCVSSNVSSLISTADDSTAQERASIFATISCAVSPVSRPDT